MGKVRDGFNICPDCDKPLYVWSRDGYDYYCPTLTPSTAGIYFREVWNEKTSRYELVEAVRIPNVRRPVAPKPPKPVDSAPKPVTYKAKSRKEKK